MWRPRCPASRSSPSTPTWSISRGCARRPGASAWPPRSIRRTLRRGARRRVRGHRAPSRGLARRRAAVLRLAVLAAGLEARRPVTVGHGAWSGTRGRAAQEVRIQLEPVHQNAPGLAGVTIETASGEAVSLDRSPGGLQAVRRARDGVRADVDRARRLARRGRDPRRGRAPGAAARPDLPAGAGLRPGARAMRIEVLDDPAEAVARPAGRRRGGGRPRRADRRQLAEARVRAGRARRLGRRDRVVLRRALRPGGPRVVESRDGRGGAALAPRSAARGDADGGRARARGAALRPTRRWSASVSATSRAGTC